MSEERAAYKHDHYVAHREEYLERARKRQEAKLERVTDEAEQKRLLENPSERPTVCRVCWLVFPKSLSRHVVCHMPLVEYRHTFGYSARTRLVSEEFGAELARRAKRSGAAERVKPHQFQKRPHATGQARTRKGVPQSLEARRKIGDHWAGQARPELKTSQVTYWEIAELRLAGKSLDAIGSKTNLDRSTVWWHLQAMNFPAGKAFEHGESITGRNLVALCADSKKTKKELSTLLGKTYNWAVQHTMRGKIDKPLSADMAEKYQILRDRLREEYRHKPATGGHPWSLFPSERASIPAKVQELHRDLRLLHRWLLENAGSVTLEEAWDWICQRSHKSKIALLFWPQFYRWLKQSYDKRAFLRGVWAPKELAVEFVADDFGVSFETVRRLVLSQSAASPGKTV